MDKHAFFSVVIIAAVTAFIRFLPALIFGGKRETSPFILYLGKVLPYAIMGMLVVYCLRDTTFSSMSAYLPQLISGAAVVILYVIKKNSLISIVGGTVCYMLLVQFVF